jgi:GT2 family glycosyltransferase
VPGDVWSTEGAPITSSVIVATKNRAKELSTLLLPSLLSQTWLPDEVIFVDQSSDNSTRKVVESFEKRITGEKPHVVYLLETNHTGAASARNSAIARTKADFLIFLDDDVVLEPDFVKELLKVYEQYPAVGGVSGVITNYSPPSLSWRIVMRLFWTGPFHDERQPIYWNADRLRNHEPFPVRKFGSGVMSVRRSAFAGDRFDERYRGAGAEDVELSWRLSERHPLMMTPRARLVHVRTETGRSQAHWLQFDALSSYYLYRRLWSHEIKNRICFGWLNVGYALLVTVSSLRRLSLEPWRAALKGADLGSEFAKRDCS